MKARMKADGFKMVVPEVFSGYLLKGRWLLGSLNIHIGNNRGKYARRDMPV
jgi:hypothetical protein